MENGCKPLPHGPDGFNALKILMYSVANIMIVPTLVVRMVFV